MKCMTQGALISLGSNTGQCEGIGKVFTGSFNLLFMLCFKVDLVLNGMAGALLRWRTFITITSPKLYSNNASVSFCTDLTEYKMLNDVAAKRSQGSNVVGIEERKQADEKRVFTLNIAQFLCLPISWFRTHTLRPSTATGINRISQIWTVYLYWPRSVLGHLIIYELYFNASLVEGDYKTVTHSRLQYWDQTYLQIFEPSKASLGDTILLGLYFEGWSWIQAQRSHLGATRMCFI